MYEIIEFLQKSDDYYYIDYIPYETSDAVSYTHLGKAFSLPVTAHGLQGRFTLGL